MILPWDGVNGCFKYNSPSYFENLEVEVISFLPRDLERFPIFSKKSLLEIIKT